MDTIQKPTNQQTFKPTAKMLVWLDTAVRLRNISPTAIEAESSVGRTSYYDWIKQPGFIEWFKCEWDRRLQLYGPHLDAIGLRNAERDHRYWQDMQKRVGNLQDPKTLTQYNIGGDMKVQFEEDAGQEVTS